MGSSPIDRTKKKPLTFSGFFAISYFKNIFLTIIAIIILRSDCTTMFFIGIFGIEEKQKHTGTINNVICPSCGAMTRFEVYKTFSYFHIFFIPTFKWNTRYYITPACCKSIYELDPDIGEQIEKGMKPEISSEHLRNTREAFFYKQCNSCGNTFDSQFNYCPFCGRKL